MPYWGVNQLDKKADGLWVLNSSAFGLSNLSNVMKCSMEKSKPFKKWTKKLSPKINIKYYKNKFNHKFAKKIPFPKFKWQKSFYDHMIRFHENHLKKEKDWDYHYDYTINNHLKHGLPEDWQYTSKNYPEIMDYIE